MKKIVNFIFLIVVCFLPVMVDARQSLELEYELENRFFLYEENGIYNYADKNLYEGNLHFYDEDGNFIDDAAFYNDELSDEENYSLIRYKFLEDIVDQYSSTVYYDSVYYYVSYNSQELNYYDHNDDWRTLYFNDNINFTKRVLGERYNVYRHFINEDIYIYRIDVFENIIVLYYDDINGDDHITIFDKEFNLIKNIDIDYYINYELVKEIDGIIYFIPNNQEIITYKLDGTELDKFEVYSDWLDKDKWYYCGTYEISHIDALNNKLFLVYDFKLCPPVRIEIPDDSAVEDVTNDQELLDGFTQVYSLVYDVDVIQSSAGSFTYLEKTLDGNLYVELDIEPNQGYVVDKIIVTDVNGNQIEVKDNKFLKPMNDVSVEVQFKQGEYLPIPDTGLGKSITLILIGAILIGLGLYTFNYVRQE